eukprot:gene2949-1198_t
MENSAETSPILNEYKQEFFLKRLPQTILGGPIIKVDTGRQPLPSYVYLYQFLIFAAPLVISSCLAIVTELGLVASYWICVVFGVIMVIFMLSLHLGLRLKSKTLKPVEEFQFDCEDDDNEIEFQGCTDINQSLKFIIHKKKYISNVFFHAFLYGIICGIIFLYLLPSSSRYVFGRNEEAVVYYVMGWIVACIGLYSLIARPPAEPCQFKATDQYETSCLTRPFHMACFAVFGIVSTFYYKLVYVDLIMRILFALLPVLWTLGILPPVDCFFAWFGEQALVYLFGGSPMSNSVRLLTMLVISCIAWLITYAVPNTTASLAIAACSGLITSLDIATGLKKVLVLLLMKFRRRSESQKIANTSSYSLSKCCYIILLIIASGLIASLTNAGLEVSKKMELRDIFGYVTIALLVLETCCGSLLTVYIFFGLVSNPVYFSIKKGKAKRLLVLCRKLLVDCVTPLVLVAFVSLTATKTSGSSTQSDVLFALFAFRAYHLAWRGQQRLAMDASVMMVIEYSSLGATWWNVLTLHTRLFLISIILGRIQHACVIFCVPMLPLFTLPIFLMGYPRPRIFFPYADNKLNSSSNDWIYYKQLMPSLLDSLKCTISSGSLGELAPGEHFLARFQDRLIWLVVAERGFLYTNFIVKGLELAETSCHTVEAARIDDIFEVTLGEKPRPVLNPYPGHCLTPFDHFELETYSDAKNVLTGIIDSPENLQNLGGHFIKSLTWVFLRFSKSRRDRGLGDGPTADDLKKKFLEREKNRHVKTTSSLTNETRETIVVSRNDSVEGILRDRSSSLYSKSSLSENSMTALWSNREPLKGSQANTQSSIPTEVGLPSVSFPPFGKQPQTASAKRSSFKGPNFVSDDDFDGFGFDDFDDNLPRRGSSHSIDNVDNDGKNNVNNIFETESTPTSDLIPQSRFTKSNALPSLVVDVSSPHSSIVEPPVRWKQSIPVEATDISTSQDLFCEDWFKFVISQLDLSSKGERVLQSISADRGLFFIFRKLVLSCYILVNEQKHKSALDVWKIFSGSLPWSRYLYWAEQDTELHQQIIIAFRYAFKLMYDEAVLGPIADFEEFAEYLTDYEENWHMGNDHDMQWINAVLNNVPSLLSVGYDKDNGTFTSRVLTKQKMTVPVGRLDSENVKAIWSSLSLELLYFTNDDEERYSIQAHPSHFRNLVIQAADPPFGYPVFSSGLTNVVAW